MFELDDALRIGTSSWSERDWVGVFYPPGTPSNEFIRHYATVYDTVEIDATFYAIPALNSVSGWRRRTPDGFKFAAKVPRLITHDKLLVDAVGDMLVFIETMAGLGDRLGPLVLQFPYFNRQAFASATPFLARLEEFLGALPTQQRYAVEIRNPRWLGRDLQELCRRHRTAVVWTEQAWMPKAEEWWRLLGGPSTDFAYVRWLGDHKAIEQITTKWSQTVVDRTQVLEQWLPVIRALRAARVDVFGFFNNHFAGHAPASIELFRELWRRSATNPSPAPS
ncbi:MAG: DUF72 domain-containing protein [Planctomycetota bacterium]